MEEYRETLVKICMGISLITITFYAISSCNPLLVLLVITMIAILLLNYIEIEENPNTRNQNNKNNEEKRKEVREMLGKLAMGMTLILTILYSISACNILLVFLAVSIIALYLLTLTDLNKDRNRHTYSE